MAKPTAGGGIIGCTTAYYLTRHPSYDPSVHNITLFEASKIAGGASGRAGGLLALWAYPSNLVPLSYRLHADLAKEHGGPDRWGYRRVHCGQLEARGRANSRQGQNGATIEKGASVSLQKTTFETAGRMKAAGIPKDLDWVAPESLQAYEEMGGPDSTAQVHPYQFTVAMSTLAEEKGVKVQLGSVTKIDYEANAVRSVTYTEKESSESCTIPARTVIISAGPWTRNVYPSAPIAALRAHSVTIRPSRPVSAYALFTEIELPKGSSGQRTRSQTVTPEIYARPNNEVYACGEGDTLVALPPSTDLVQVDERRCQDIVEQVGAISDELRDGQVLVRQACYLPNLQGAVKGPLIGETGVKGLLMAAGHTCWGIQNGPATGKLVSEIVFDGKAKSADIRSLDPRRVL